MAKPDTAAEKFNKLCWIYTYPRTPDSVKQLLEFWEAGITAGRENPSDISKLAFISQKMQENARASSLYDEYPELEEINDGLLRFEDMDYISEDEDRSILDWHIYMDGLLIRTKEILNIQ
jgi:hypothetical protein